MVTLVEAVFFSTDQKKDKVMKISKATLVITLITAVLIALTAWATIFTGRQESNAVDFDNGIISAVESGDAQQVSAYFTEGISFYNPETGNSDNKKDASKALNIFFSQHLIKDFSGKRIIPGRLKGLSYLKGTLVTPDQNYGLYSTIYDNQIEQLDITTLK